MSAITCNTKKYEWKHKLLTFFLRAQILLSISWAWGESCKVSRFTYEVNASRDSCFPLSSTSLTFFSFSSAACNIITHIIRINQDLRIKLSRALIWYQHQHTHLNALFLLSLVPLNGLGLGLGISVWFVPGRPSGAHLLFQLKKSQRKRKKWKKKEIREGKGNGRVLLWVGKWWLRLEGCSRRGFEWACRGFRQAVSLGPRAFLLLWGFCSSVEAGEVSKWNLECELAYLLRERGTRSEREKKEDWEENKKKQGF